MRASALLIFLFTADCLCLPSASLMPVVALCTPVSLAQGRMLPLGRGLVELLQGEEAKSAVLRYIKKKSGLFHFSFLFFSYFFYILSNPGKKNSTMAQLAP